MALNFLIAPALFALLDGTSLRAIRWRSTKNLRRAVALNMAVVSP